MNKCCIECKKFSNCDAVCTLIEYGVPDCNKSQYSNCTECENFLEKDSDYED